MNSREKTESNLEILERFIVDFYTKYTPPKNVLMNKNLKDQKLITNSLRSIYGFRTNFVVPKQGKKLDIVTYAKKNSNLSLQAHITQSMNNKQTLKTLQSVLEIKKILKIKTVLMTLPCGYNHSLSLYHVAKQQDQSILCLPFYSKIDRLTS